MTPKELGQYFTPDAIADFMIDLLGSIVTPSFLEPSCGEGVFIDKLLDRGFSDVVGYEIDDRVAVKNPDHIEFASFVTAELDRKFGVVIGNPPYVRWKNLPQSAREELLLSCLWNQYCNSFCDFFYFFILRSVELLEDGGQLVFITPGYWLSTTHAVKMRNYLVEHGSFERICCFNESPIFKDVASSIIVFKYVKGRQPTKVIVSNCDSKDVNQSLLSSILTLQDAPGVVHFETSAFSKDERWVLADDSTRATLKVIEDKSSHTLGEVSKIGNGMVTGLDKAFQIPKGLDLTPFECYSTRKILKGKDTGRFNHGDFTRYIFDPEVSDEEEFKVKCPNFYELLTPYWNDLKKRYCYGKDIKPWQWVFLRNYAMFSQGFPRILVPGKERITHKSHFRFCHAKQGVFPTQDVSGVIPNENFREGIYYLLAVLNGREIFQWVKYNGIIKGGVVEFSERPLSIIPIRRINWDDPDDVSLYFNIVEKTKLLCHNEYSPEQLDEVLDLVSSLYH